MKEDRWTLESPHLTVEVSSYGARLVRVLAPDRAGKRGDVVLGYDTVREYEADTRTYFGAIVGRYGNRIAKGTFTLDGRTYHVPGNDHGNALHGGRVGFDRLPWSGRKLPNAVELTLVSAAGDQGFPGTLTARVTYSLEADLLRIAYQAETDAPTVVNLTNHAYFDLDGGADILSHELQLFASRMLPVGADLIPTGELASVAGTPFDFREPTPIGRRIAGTHPQLGFGHGYDHTWVLDGAEGGLRRAAHVRGPASGRTLTVETTEPGVQFYSGNFLDGTNHGRGRTYGHRAGFCLETQHFPDSPNHPRFPSTVLRPGTKLHSETSFRFGVRS